MVDALSKIYKTEGIKGLYRGFVPGMFGVSHGALQFMTYEEMKNRYNEYRKLPIDTKLVSNLFLLIFSRLYFVLFGKKFYYVLLFLYYFEFFLFFLSKSHVLCSNGKHAGHVSLWYL